MLIRTRSTASGQSGLARLGEFGARISCGDDMEFRVDMLLEMASPSRTGR